MAYIRDDQADIRVTINGTPYGDSWATYQGGVLTAAASKTRPGGMGDEVSVGGAGTRSDITLTIQLTDIVSGWHTTLEGLLNARVKVGVHWLGPDKLPTGSSFTRVGTLQEAALPNADHNSSNVGFYTIVVACDQQAA